MPTLNKNNNGETKADEIIMGKVSLRVLSISLWNCHVGIRMNDVAKRALQEHLAIIALLCCWSRSKKQINKTACTSLDTKNKTTNTSANCCCLCSLCACKITLFLEETNKSELLSFWGTF